MNILFVFGSETGNRDFPFQKNPQESVICVLVVRFLFLFENNPKNLDWSYKMDLHFKKNLKILDPSYEMDLDIQDYFGRKNMQCFCQRMLYMRCKKVVQYLDSKDSDQLAEYAVFYMDLSGFPIFFFLLCLAFFNAAGQHSFESTTSQYFG